ncbi:MAG: methyltransferase domain-containing protein [Hyphomicrobiaceae bacterium]|nr:MAG: methyltransferase domain-containing protein [Hyphomicrobiaceae bacterium]
MVAIAGFTREQIFAAVQQMYGEVATAPLKQFHFPTGRSACLFTGYPETLLEGIPATALESFAGVGCPFRAGIIRPGDRVLDIGAGSGTDTLIAARLAGPQGRVLALDLTPQMLGKLRCNIALAGASNIEVIAGNAEAIPLLDASVDVVTSNGVLNLVPDKGRAFAEIWRVLRPGGRVQIADIVVSRPVGDKARKDPKLWAECVVGAMIEEDYVDLLRSAGFGEVEILRNYDYFSASSSSETRKIAGALGAKAAELTMHKPVVASSGTARHGWMRWLRPVHLARRAARHGHLGLMTSLASIAACYGVLAVVSALAFMGLAAAVDTLLWTAVIAALTALAPLALAWNVGVHRNMAPALVGAAGAVLVLYAVLARYDWRIEAIGFGVLLGAALWDRHLFRRAIGC